MSVLRRNPLPISRLRAAIAGSLNTRGYIATANWDSMYVLSFLSDMGIKRSEQQTSDNDIGNHFCNHDDFAALSCLGAAQGIRFQKVKQ
jgi:hypothetical protein